jgi:hypothetical protein
MCTGVVGTKHKKSTDHEKRDVKKQKREAKRSNNDNQEDVVCKNCHGKGHTSSRSKECPNRKLTKQEQVQSLLGNHTSITRKIKLDTILKPAYKTSITNKVRIVSEHVRNIMIRAQIFVNYYVITHANQTVDKKVYTQNFWYCITQLVLKKVPKNTKALPNDCLSCWNSFSSRYQVTYDMTPVVNGYSNCVTAACVEMATIYTNMIVECFENRVIAFLVRGIRELFDKVKKKKKKSYL